MAQTNIKNEILNATITVFNKKGMKFNNGGCRQGRGHEQKDHICSVF